MMVSVVNFGARDIMGGEGPKPKGLGNVVCQSGVCTLNINQTLRENPKQRSNRAKEDCFTLTLPTEANKEPLAISVKGTPQFIYRVLGSLQRVAEGGMKHLTDRKKNH